jgi:hypothetical protein
LEVGRVHHPFGQFQIGPLLHCSVQRIKAADLLGADVAGLLRFVGDKIPNSSHFAVFKKIPKSEREGETICPNQVLRFKNEYGMSP